MMDVAPRNDLDALERHRKEAQRYLPKTDEQYQAEIDAGTDAYTSKWFGWALVAAAVAVVVIAIVDLACGGSAQC